MLHRDGQTLELSNHGNESSETRLIVVREAMRNSFGARKSASSWKKNCLTRTGKKEPKPEEKTVRSEEGTEQGKNNPKRKSAPKEHRRKAERENDHRETTRAINIYQGRKLQPRGRQTLGLSSANGMGENFRPRLGRSELSRPAHRRRELPGLSKAAPGSSFFQASSRSSSSPLTRIPHRASLRFDRTVDESTRPRFLRVKILDDERERLSIHLKLRNIAVK